MSTGTAVQPLSFTEKDKTIRSWYRWEDDGHLVVAAPGYYNKYQIPEGRKGDLIRVYSDTYCMVLKITSQDAVGSYITIMTSCASGAAGAAETEWERSEVNDFLIVAPGGTSGHSVSFTYDWTNDDFVEAVQDAIGLAALAGAGIAYDDVADSISSALGNLTFGDGLSSTGLTAVEVKPDAASPYTVAVTAAGVSVTPVPSADAGNIFKLGSDDRGFVDLAAILENFDNDLAVGVDGKVETGAPLHRDTTTTGAFYRHWANNRNTDPAFAGSGFLSGLKYTTLSGIWAAALKIGSYSDISGYLHTNASGNYNQISGYVQNVAGSFLAVFGQQHQVTAGVRSIYAGYNHRSRSNDSAFFGYRHGLTAEIAASYSVYAGYQHNGNSNYAAIFGRLHETSGSYHLLAGNDHTVSGTASRVTGGNHTVGGSYNDVGGLSHEVTSSYSAVFGYNHTVTRYGNIVAGYNQNVTGYQSAVFGSGNSSNGAACTISGISHAATGSYHTLFGYDHTVAGSFNTALGRTNKIFSGSYSFATGYSHEITGTGNMAIGYDNHMTGAYSVSLGRSNRQTVGNDNVLIGRSNTSDLGNDNIAVGKSITNNNGNSVIVAGPGQRLGFFNAAPVVKQSSTGINTVAELVAALQAYGLLT